MDSKKLKPRRWPLGLPPRISLLVGLVAILVLLLVGYSYQTSRHMTLVYVPQMNALMEIRIETTLAHLWFEETISGDRQEDVSLVWEHLDASTWFAHAMLEGDENPHWTYYPLEDSALRLQVEKILKKIEEFRAIAEQRYPEREISGIGSEIDQHFDLIFAELMERTKAVEQNLQALTGRKNQQFKIIQIELLVVCFFSAVLVYAVLSRYLTERRKVQEVLQASEEGFRFLFNSSKDCIVILDRDLNYIHANRSANNYLGLEESDTLEGKNIREALAAFPDFRDVWIERLERYFETEQPIWVEDSVPVGDQLAWSESSLSPIRDASGNLTAVGIIYRDITERKRAGETLRESEERYRNVYRTAPLAFVLWDCECCVTGWNDRAEEIFGWSSQEILGENFFEFLIPESARPRVDDVVQAILRKELERDVVNENLTKSGETIVCQWNNSILYNNDGRVIGALSLGLDITQRVRAEEEIRKLNEELEERVRRRTAQLEAANQELEAFAYSVSHDLRAPLRSMDGFSQMLLQDHSKNLNTVGKDYLQRVCAASERMAQLIDDILNLSRVTRVEMRHEAVDLSVLAQSVSAELEELEPGRKVECSVVPGLVAHGDARLLRTALANLLGNAWKFTRDRDTTRIELGLLASPETPGEEVIYFVRDNGAGFDETYADKLFGAFQRLHREEEFPGSGVGLATVQRIIHRHGGRVWAEGKVGEGATFYFTLPQVFRG